MYQEWQWWFLIIFTSKKTYDGYYDHYELLLILGYIHVDLHMSGEVCAKLIENAGNLK